MNNTWQEVYLTIAESLASHSKCAAKGVGCILVKDQAIVSSGVNGTPSGYINCNEIFFKDHEKNIWYSTSGSGKSSPVNPEMREVLEGDKTHKCFSEEQEIHAEVNAILKLGKNGLSSEGLDLYCNYSPCFNCAKTIVQAGIKNVYYRLPFDNEEAVIDYLEINGINVVRLVSNNGV